MPGHATSKPCSTSKIAPACRRAYELHDLGRAIRDGGLQRGRVTRIVIADASTPNAADRLIRHAVASAAELTLAFAGALGVLGVAARPGGGRALLTRRAGPAGVSAPDRQRSGQIVRDRRRMRRPGAGVLPPLPQSVRWAVHASAMTISAPLQLCGSSGGSKRRCLAGRDGAAGRSNGIGRGWVTFGA